VFLAATGKNLATNLESCKGTCAWLSDFGKFEMKIPKLFPSQDAPLRTGRSFYQLTFTGIRV
jgi:hypothetical protein